TSDGGQGTRYSLSMTDSDDSAPAIDDDIWRQFDLAEEYHAMGVIANREASWEEAQYYFEKALHIMALLDVETRTIATPESAKYTEILENIVADYRVALRSLGALTDDVSSSVIIERFGDIIQNLDSDTMRVFESQEIPITYDFPVVMNDRVKNSIVYFQTVANEAFNKYLRRSKKYTPMMKRILRQYELPEDLIYLSLIESGYNPHAYSWARAMGLWQFIASTGRMYKLNRDWWIDERKDPIKSTHAACQFLKDLYEQFGSWDLAMAAYNGGPGRVRRTIKKQGTRDFWKLKLKRQTMDYVPLIMAATIISKDPQKYGFDNIEHEPEVVWDEVEIDRCLDLRVVAEEIGCKESELKTLNPELLRRYTPPNRKKYTLKVPKGLTEKFFAAYDKMPSPKETSWVRHRIRKGETVSTIASRYGVSQYAIFAANNLSRRSRIYAGKDIIVPVPLDSDYKGGGNRKDYDSYQASNSLYVVRAGDTPWDIARAFGTTVSALRSINYIEKGSRIYVGQKLKIPSSATKLKQKSSSGRKTYASAPTQQSTSSGGKGSSKTTTHKVRAGDTLWDLARQYGTTTGKIRRLNGLGGSSRIYAGQVLKITGTSSKNYVVHKVRGGDTLSRIAQRYGTSTTRIMANNGLTNPDQLYIGAELKIFTK
ncbi:MAG: LysM peptidoglycan-binding domain-containing protein, partial [bacterium]|nr:LysM peptidoglycan-binding domain-containing protein [bacterium]